MPSEVTFQSGLPSSMDRRSSLFYEESIFPAERQVGFWKTDTIPGHQGVKVNGISLMTDCKSDSSSLSGKGQSITVNSVNHYDHPQSCVLNNNSEHDEHLISHEKSSSVPVASWRPFGTHSGLCVRDTGPGLNVHNYENSLFSSSLSDMFTRKLRLASAAGAYGQSVGREASHLEEDESLESLKEIEAQTIGNLLPDDDDLFSGVVDELEYVRGSNKRDDVDDVDLFSTGGGMELEIDDALSGSGGIRSSDLFGGFYSGQQVCPGSPFAGEHPYGEHPSRTLFVRNINSNVEDSELKGLFEQYGDIRTLYTACKHRGFVMISYYDIRAARNAMRALQNKPLRRRKLDIHFSIPKDNPSEKDINQGTLVVFNLDSSVSNDELRQIFGVHGEIKEIRETPHKHHHKFIEFYDVRAAEAALRALNRSDIAGKRIKLEPSRPGGARRCLMQQFSPEVDQEETGGGQQQGSPSHLLSGSIPHDVATSSSANNDVLHSLHSSSKPPVNPFAESQGVAPAVAQTLSSPVMIASAVGHGDQPSRGEPGLSLSQLKFGYRSMSSIHTQSFPDCHNGASMRYGLPGIMPVMSAALNTRSEGTDNQHVHRAGLGGLGEHCFESNERVYGPSGNGSCHLPGHHFMWGNTNYPPPPTAPGIWPNSLPYLNGIHGHLQHHMHGLPRAPSHVLSNALPLPHNAHHVGSAPTVNPSLWDRHQTYAGDSTELFAFHPSSLESLGFSDGSNLVHVDLATHKMFPLVGGACFDPTIPSISSPQQRGHMFPGRSPIMPPVHGCYDSPAEHRVRSRRSEVGTNQTDNKKQYELDIDRIVRSEDTRTTLMIKNIPNKYTSKMLLAAIDEHHRGTYDFIYLPIDFKNKCNVGYAFINMIDASQIIAFYQAFNGKKWEKFNSEKVASLAYARIQGKAALIAHFQNSSLMNEDKRCRPILFHSDGPNAGDQEPFPVGVNIRCRAGRNKANISNEETHQGSPSASANGEEGSTGADSSSGSSKESE